MTRGFARRLHERLARSAAVRHVRVRHAPQRAALARRRARSWSWRSGASRRWAPARSADTISGMSHDHATVAEEEYLQTIFWLQEAGLPMTGANVARAMQLSAPTVHEMIGRLERDGYVTRGADKALVVHRQRARARRGHRPPPPADRALPDRRARHPVGRGARGGRAARARDVAGARGAHARRDRRRQDVPARASDPRRRADRRRAAGRRRGRREGAHPALRERGGGPAALPQGLRASSRAWRAR